MKQQDEIIHRQHKSADSELKSEIWKVLERKAQENKIYPVIFGSDFQIVQNGDGFKIIGCNSLLVCNASKKYHEPVRYEKFSEYQKQVRYEKFNALDLSPDDISTFDNLKLNNIFKILKDARIPEIALPSSALYSKRVEYLKKFLYGLRETGVNTLEIKPIEYVHDVLNIGDVLDVFAVLGEVNITTLNLSKNYTLISKLGINGVVKLLNVLDHRTNISHLNLSDVSLLSINNEVMEIENLNLGDQNRHSLSSLDLQYNLSSFHSKKTQLLIYDSILEFVAGSNISKLDLSGNQLRDLSKDTIKAISHWLGKSKISHLNLSDNMLVYGGDLEGNPIFDILNKNDILHINLTCNIAKVRALHLLTSNKHYAFIVSELDLNSRLDHDNYSVLYSNKKFDSYEDLLEIFGYISEISANRVKDGEFPFEILINKNCHSNEEVRGELLAVYKLFEWEFLHKVKKCVMPYNYIQQALKCRLMSDAIKLTKKVCSKYHDWILDSGYSIKFNKNAQCDAQKFREYLPCLSDKILNQQDEIAAVELKDLYEYGKLTNGMLLSAKDYLRNTEWFKDLKAFSLFSLIEFLPEEMVIELLTKEDTSL